MLSLSPEDVTSSSLYRVLAVLTVPLLLQNCVKIVQSVVDLFWLGHLSDGGAAIAANGLTSPVLSIAFILTATIPYIGTQVLVSQRVGNDDTFGARKGAFNGLVLATIISIGVSVIGYFAAPTIIRFLTITQPTSASADIVPKAIEYFRFLAVFTVLLGWGDTIEASLVARGDSRASFYIVVANVATNAIADPIFIFGLGPAPALGLLGSGIAYHLGSLFGLLVGVVFVVRGRQGGVLSWNAMEFEVSELRELLQRGLPPAGQRAVRNLASVVTIVIVFTAGGAAGLTAYVVGSRALRVARIPAVGIQSATQSIVGQNLGASKPDRASRTTKIGVLYINAILAPLVVVQFVMSGAIVNLLVPNIGAEAAELARMFLRLLAVSYPVLGTMSVLQGGFNGANRGRISFFSSTFQYWVVQVPLASAVGIWLGHGIVGVFGAIVGATAVTGVAVVLYYHHVVSSGMFETVSKEVDEAGTAAG